MANGFREVQFPNQIAANAIGGPRWNTDIAVMGSGAEQRNQAWTWPLYEYNVATGLKGAQDIYLLQSFFLNSLGRAVGFRFRDWSDYQAIGQTIGTGDNTTKIFQMVKNYSDGFSSFTRPLKKPAHDYAPAVYINGVAQPGTAWSIDYTTGLITINAAPAAGQTVTADCWFDVPCRFDTDWLDLKIINYQVAQWERCMLKELRNP